MPTSQNSEALCRTLSSVLSSGSEIDWDEAEEWAAGIEDNILGRLRSISSFVQAPHKSRLESPASTEQLGPGDLVADRYRVESFLDRGGMGEVYKATDELLDVQVALKIISTRAASNLASLQGFKREVLLARSITHPNVCRIYDLGWDAERDVAYLTMEFLAGRTLREQIRSVGPLEPAEALPLFKQLADGLNAAHRAGVIHRDFKSGNIMLVEERDTVRAVILDFGLALECGDSADSSRQTTPSRKVVGTPAYMAPEQVTLGDLTPSSDLYALGVVMFEAMTGRLPFEYQTPLEVALAHVNDSPPSPGEYVELEPVWEDAILKLLAKAPRDRFPTASDAVLALEGREVVDPAPRYALPAVRDSFIGRGDELDSLARHLEGRRQQLHAASGQVKSFAREKGRRQLVTLLGPGGTGKTRLALEYGWHSLPRWPGGVWFCDLAEARTLDGLAYAVADALNVSLGRDDPVVRLGDALSARGKTLVILDNFEQIAEHAETVLGSWLRKAPDASFLVTSRTRLHLADEFLFELNPLDPPTLGIELFEARAQSHRPGFTVDGSNRQRVEEIVQHLDGLPLALELAASRLHMLTLEQLRNRLEDRFKVLAGNRRGRHGTLRAALDWSWELLEPWEQSAMMQIAVFEGGFSLEAAEAVIDLSPHDSAFFVLDVIQSLVDKSWIRATVAGGDPRFEIYRTVHEYATEKLHGEAEPVEIRQVEIRHGDYFARMGSIEEIRRLSAHGESLHFLRLRLELDNLVTACERAIQRGDEDAAAATYVAANAILGMTGPFGLSIELGRQLLDAMTDATSRRRVAVDLSNVERQAGEMDAAKDHGELALKLVRSAGDRALEGIILGNLGIHYMIQGQMEDARQHYDAALSIAREVGDRDSEGRVMGNLGNLHWEQGRMEEAREHLEAALTLHRATDNRRREGLVLGNLGALEASQGRLNEALHCLEAALALHREVGNRNFEGAVLGNLGIVHWEQGRRAEARRDYETALALHRELGNRRYEGILLGNLGRLDCEDGRVEEGRRRLEASLVIHEALGNRRVQGIALSYLGCLDLETGDLQAARSRFEAALDLHREVGNRTYEGVDLGHLGTTLDLQGQPAKAEPCFETGLAILREQRDLPNLGRLLCGLGEYRFRQGAQEAARLALAEAESIASDLGVGEESELSRAMARLRRLLSD